MRAPAHALAGLGGIGRSPPRAPPTLTLTPMFISTVVFSAAISGLVQPSTIFGVIFWLMAGIKCITKERMNGVRNDMIRGMAIVLMIVIANSVASVSSITCDVGVGGRYPHIHVGSGRYPGTVAEPCATSRRTRAAQAVTLSEWVTPVNVASAV